MTFREKLAKEHPEQFRKSSGVAFGCPFKYGYEKEPSDKHCKETTCRQCWDREIPTEKTYEEGLQDAWELAKKIDLFDTEERIKIFGYMTSEYIKEHYTVQEALAKLKAYEEEKEIKVGDVVRLNNSKYTYVVTVIYEERGLTYYCGIAESGRWFAQSDVIKTGKHIDIESLLGQIRGE